MQLLRDCLPAHVCISVSSSRARQPRHPLTPAPTSSSRRGYPIQELTEASYLESAYLVLYGNLPARCALLCRCCCRCCHRGAVLLGCWQEAPTFVLELGPHRNLCCMKTHDVPEAVAAVC